MWKNNPFASRLGIKYPLIQGPFGGGLSTSTLAAKVSNAGGLGSYGAHLLSGPQIEGLVKEIRQQTEQPFAINLWVSEQDASASAVTREDFQNCRDDYLALYRSLKIAPPEWSEEIETRLEEQVESVLKTRPAVLSFVFGIPSNEVLTECRKRGIITIVAATTAEEALAIEEAGCDMVLATGFEAGGHRPSFLDDAEDSLMGNLALIPLIKDRVKIPVIAAGGIADSRGIKASFALGADAVQLGTAFLACEESGASRAHREQLFKSASQRTVLSRAFTGRLARYLPNELIRWFERNQQSALPFPRQGQLTSPIRKMAIELQDRDHMALYASQSAPTLKHRTVDELMNSLISEMDT